MTVSTMTWAGNNLAHVDEEGGITIDDAVIGSNQRMLDGTLRAEIIAKKARITLKWDGLTAAERTTLLGVYNTYGATASTLVLPDSQSFSVLAVDGWRESPWWSRGGTEYYNVTITFDEV